MQEPMVHTIVKCQMCDKEVAIDGTIVRSVVCADCDRPHWRYQVSDKNSTIECEPDGVIGERECE